MPLAEHYNKRYSENETVFGGGKPEKFVMDIPQHMSSGSVLELGAGEGRNSLYLAEQGFTVTARDLSRVGTEKIAKAAEEKGLTIQAEIKDIREWSSDIYYDIFVCTYVVHHLTRKEALLLLKNVQRCTATGGLNVITAFTQNGDFYQNNPATENFYPEAGELKKLYGGWNILAYEEVETRAFRKKPDGTPMRNISAKLIARK